ncbi:MAG: peptidase [bacterium]
MMRMNASLTTSLVVLTLCVPFAGCGGGGGGGSSEEGYVDFVAQDCAWVGHGEVTAIAEIEDRLTAYAETDLTADITTLTASERQVLDKLVAAARIMHELFWAQACPCREEITAVLDRATGPGAEAARAYFQINMGPWDRRFGREPFCGHWEHPEGANYYPLDLTEAEKEQISSNQNRLGDLFTMVRRDDSGALVAIPYSEFFKDELEQAAGLLREAAAITDNESLRLFLESRADAFLSDDYYESDMLWMDLDSRVEITIGPYETYEDGLFGFKAAFEAFVTVVDPEGSARLDRFKGELPWLEANLPIPDQYKNPNRGAESPIRVADEYFTAGDTRAGVQTIAFNLPNDERVREAKGSKKVMLRNIMNAKFEQILVPIANRLLAEGQLPDLTGESFFLHTLLHEMSHGLGPGNIVVDGRPTEVRLELKDHYSTIEEAKADLMGEWAIFQLMDKGLFEPTLYRQQAATYLAGLFRSVRFGIEEAHGQANAIQFNYLLSRGGIQYDEETQRFRVNLAEFRSVIERMVNSICVLQAEGNYTAAHKMVTNYGVMSPELEQALARLTDLPADIKPIFVVE